MPSKGELYAEFLGLIRANFSPSETRELYETCLVSWGPVNRQYIKRADDLRRE